MDMMTNKAEPVSTNKLASAPLVHVLAQVRYSSVLTISRSIPAIQEGLKKVGFPRFEKGEAQNIVLGPGVAPRVDRIERWDFLSRDRRTGVVLTPEFVVIQTSTYGTFVEFRELLFRTFEILKAEVEIDIVERLGIRYVDLVRLDGGESFSDYLKPGLVGFPFAEIRDEGFNQAFSTTHSIAELPSKSMLSVKCLQANNGTFLPPDLMPTVLHYDVSLSPLEVVTMLDFDHYSLVDMNFEPADLVSQLDELHKVANKAFRAALNSYAYQKWGGAGS